MSKLLNSSGMGLIEVMIAASLFLVLALGAMSFFESQLKASNYLELKSQREQLRLVLLDQVLKFPDNCKCMFAGATEFPVAGSTELVGFTSPTAIGKYQPSNCSGGVPQPFVNTTGIDNLKLTSLKLTDIVLSGGSYSGKLTLALQSTREVLGPKDVILKIDVLVATVPGSTGNVVFQNCSLGAAPTGGNGIDYSDYLNNGPQWTLVTSVPAGGPLGVLATAPGFPLNRVHPGVNYFCGPVDVVTITRPSVTNATRAALIGFYTSNFVEPSHLIRVFTMTDQFVGGAGQAGRGGDGASFGTAAEMLVPLVNGRFKMQTCQRDGDPSDIYYSVKGTIF